MGTNQRCRREQAWSSAAEERVGRWPCLHYPVSDTDRPVLRLQLHHRWTTRDSAVARSQLVDEIDHLRPHHHPPKEERILPVQEALQGSPHPVWSVYIYTYIEMCEA